jgi:hypothetical protein
MAKQAKQLDDLFEDLLKDIYYAEKKILTTLPKMAKAAKSPDLKAAFEKHERETEGQVERLEKVFGMLDQSPKGKKCEAIEGLVKEGQEGIKEIQGVARSRCRTSRDRSGCGALRDFPLRHPHRLGQPTRNAAGREAAAADTGRGKKDGRGSDRAGGRGHQSGSPRSSLKSRVSCNSSRGSVGSNCRKNCGIPSHLQAVAAHDPPHLPCHKLSRGPRDPKIGSVRGRGTLGTVLAARSWSSFVGAHSS